MGLGESVGGGRWQSELLTPIFLEFSEQYHTFTILTHISQVISTTTIGNNNYSLKKMSESLENAEDNWPSSSLS